MDAVSMYNVITLLLYLSALEKKEGKKEIFCFHLISSVSIGFRVNSSSTAVKIRPKSG